MKMTMTFEITTHREVLVTPMARDAWECVSRRKVIDTLLRELGFTAQPLRTEITFENGERP